MARQNPRSASSKNKAKPQSTTRSLSPGEVRNTTDPGDEMQRRLRYQHAYGVILLAASLRKELPYIAIWCEQHDDLLGEWADGLYDAYQIKTKENDMWALTDESLKKSIKRFVILEQQFPGWFRKFKFVSNAGYENSSALNKIARSPSRFLTAIGNAATHADLPPPFDEVFETLRVYCACNAESLLAVFKKLEVSKGPDLDGFEAIIAHQHLSPLPECSSWPADSLAALCKELIAWVSRASSLSVDDPSRHWVCLFAQDHPGLKAKRITVETITSYIKKNSARFLGMVQTTGHLSEFLEETLRLFLLDSWKKDQFAKLDQAGETDPNRSTLLCQVFVDPELWPRIKPLSMLRRAGQSGLFEFTALSSELDVQEWVLSDRDKSLSAMDCLLKDPPSKIVIIGGPGQGKSTLGQFLAQVHRAALLHREEELYCNAPGKTRKQKSFKPKTVRVPFRIVLKYFAQWLADGPSLESVEAYLAEQIGKGASRPDKISASDVQEILKYRSALVIFDGLDEVAVPDLHARMIERVEEFLERAEDLGSDLQVLATSRPMGYSGQFNPQEYWHMKLQPMSPGKAQEYAARWVEVKVTLEEEQQRIKDTLQAYLQEEHTRWLLMTPMQVTIVLLIIRDGGRPPTQRTALFQQYWDTILRWEKAKFKGMIRTDEGTLFNLHAYLGYELHRRATSNGQALLPEQAFTELVYDFLRKEDHHHSPEQTLRQRVELIVQEARERLVLLVEPKPGLFGFELQPLQEFFAGSYLAQTVARDTKQCFVLFRAIARSEHWHNVALFFASSIAHNFRDKAEKFLIYGCMPIDRNGPDRYLRRGAWLALDIVADGIFAQNRDLQYSFLEYALTILDGPMTPRDQEHLTSALQRLSLEDRRDMLGGILKQKLNTLSLPYQPQLLKIYGQFIGPQPEFIRGLETLLASHQPDYIQRALALGFQRLDGRWLAQQLEKYWQLWIGDDNARILQQWWHESRQGIQAVPPASFLSEDQIDSLLHTPFLFPEYSENPSSELLRNPQTPAEQVVVFLQCSAISDYINRLASQNTSFGQNRYFSSIHLGKAFKEQIYSYRSGLSTALDQLMKRDDLMLPLRISLWVLYWQLHEPTEATVAAFLEESKAWGKEVTLELFKLWLDNSRPLLILALEQWLNNSQDAVQRLLPLLSRSKEIAIDRQVSAAIEKLRRNRSVDEWNEFILDFYSGNVNAVPELVSLAEQLGIEVSELMDKYPIYLHLSIDRDRGCSAEFLQRVFAMMEGITDQPLKIWRVFGTLVDKKWSMDQETLGQGKGLLYLLIEKVSQQPHLSEVMVFLYLKLLTFDRSVYSQASSLLSALANAGETLMSIWTLAEVAADIPSERLAALTYFCKHRDQSIQRGAHILWKALIEAILSHLRPSPRITRARAYSNFINVGSSPQKFERLRFDWRIGFAQFNESDAASRKRGITLLTLSNYPLAEQSYSEALLHAMQRAQDEQEITAWAFFLQRAPLDFQQSAWQALLEQILDQPRLYTTGILAAAKERYSALVGEAGPDIGGDAKELGLPE